MVKCPKGWSLRATLKKKKFWFLSDRPDQKWPKSGYKNPYPQHKGQLFSNWSGSVRWTKQTLHPKKGGGFGYMKTLLLPKNLANEKGGGYVKPPMLSFWANAPPPPGAHRAKFACRQLPEP